MLTVLQNVSTAPFARTKPIDELFNMTEYLAGMSQDARPFLQRLTSTQMFWVMVHQWLGSSTADRQLLFFEECAIAMKNRRAGAVVPCRAKEAIGLTEGGRRWATKFLFTQHNKRGKT